MKKESKVTNWHFATKCSKGWRKVVKKGKADAKLYRWIMMIK